MTKTIPFFPITKEDLNKLLYTILHSPTHTGYRGNKKFLRMRDYMIVKLSAYCGLRPKEVIMLKLVDIDLKRRLIFVSKWSNKVRQDGTVAIPEVIYKELVAYIHFRLRRFRSCHKRSPYLFPSLEGDHISRFQNARLFRKYTREAGINYVIRVRRNGQHVLRYSPYSLRHFCGTETWKATHDLKSVQVMLRHSRLESSGVYVHLDEDAKKSIANRVFNEKTSGGEKEAIQKPCLMPSG